MAATKRIKRALVSVFHKEGLDEILKKLHNEGVTFVSTGNSLKRNENENNSKNKNTGIK